METISLATSSFDFNSCGKILKSLSIKVTLFVGFPKPAPSSFKEFNTIKSKFFFTILAFACSISFSVSSAKPIKYWDFFISPREANISGFFSNSIIKVSSFFLIFDFQSYLPQNTNGPTVNKNHPFFLAKKCFS